MQYKHIIFDLDGTLIDTELAVLKTWQRTMREWGREETLDTLRIVLGIPTTEALNHLGITNHDGYQERWMELYHNAAEDMKWFPQAEELLDTLHSHGCTLGVVTSRLSEEFDSYFARFYLREKFDCIVPADSTEQHKPKPEPLFHYMQLTGAKPEECIYIGDMPTDILCANRAGIASGLVKWNGSDITCDTTDYIFDSPTDLLKKISL